MFNLAAIQTALAEFNIDGWLLYDFHGSNPLARRILEFEEESLTTRRWFYMIPQTGTPQKLVHNIEQAKLDHLPGDKRVYLRWQQLEDEIKALVKGMKNVAMEYSPRNAIPYVSKVDAGTVEIVREGGANVVSSGDLIQQFEATLTDEQWQSHLEAERHTLAAYKKAIDAIRERVKQGGTIKETEVQAVMLDYFEANHLVPDHAPIVAKGPHSGDPHYSPVPGSSDAEIGKGDFVLLDMWCKLEAPASVFADYTRVVFVGETVPEEYTKVFTVVRDARDAAIALVRDKLGSGETVRGWQVDDATRDVIAGAGYGDYIMHRTGHSIAEDLHGNGTHMDNLETRDERSLLPRTCFSVEPGIYSDKFGIRSEINVYIDEKSHVHVTGDPQQEVTPIL